MKNNYVLIDYENVQPKNLGNLKGLEFSVMVFVGDKQKKMPIELVTAMQALGDKAEYIQIDGNGPNALDFHVAFYMGTISASDPTAFFHIISKDKGFDPLIKHMKSKGILATRERDIADIRRLKILNLKSNSERVDEFVKFLKSRGNAKPTKVKTLTNSIKNYFLNTLQDSELTELYKELVHRKIAIVDDTKVSYKLPG